MPIAVALDGKLGQMVKMDFNQLKLRQETTTRVMTKHQVDSIQVPVLIGSGAAVGVVQAELVRAVNAHVFRVAVPVGINGTMVRLSQRRWQWCLLSISMGITWRTLIRR